MPPLKLSNLSGSNDLISMSQAAKLTPYSGEYLGLLARKGALEAVKIGRDWLTTSSAVVAYLRKQQAKHTKILTKLQAAERRMV